MHPSCRPASLESERAQRPPPSTGSTGGLPACRSVLTSTPAVCMRSMHACMHACGRVSTHTHHRGRVVLQRGLEGAEAAAGPHVCAVLRNVAHALWRQMPQGDSSQACLQLCVRMPQGRCGEREWGAYASREGAGAVVTGGRDGRQAQGQCALEGHGDDPRRFVGTELGGLGEGHVFVRVCGGAGILRADLRMHVQSRQAARGAIHRVVHHGARLDDHAGRQVALGAGMARSCTPGRCVCRRQFSHSSTTANNWKHHSDVFRWIMHTSHTRWYLQAVLPRHRTLQTGGPVAGCKLWHEQLLLALRCRRVLHQHAGATAGRRRAAHLSADATPAHSWQSSGKVSGRKMLLLPPYTAAMTHETLTHDVRWSTPHMPVRIKRPVAHLPPPHACAAPPPAPRGRRCTATC